MQRERPILFSAPMVRAILKGRKTQTRRMVKGVPMFSAEHDARWHPHAIRPGGACPDSWSWWEGPAHGPSMYHKAACPYGRPGDRLWVREAFIHEPADYCWEASVSIPVCPASTIYRADAVDPRGGAWKSPIYMPRSLSRITLEITGVRVERLQEISTKDCWAEGISPSPDVDPIHEYRDLWESINGPGSWDSNPWVWVIDFRKVQHESAAA